MFLIVPQSITLCGNCKNVLQRYDFFSRKAKYVAYTFLHFPTLKQSDSYILAIHKLSRTIHKLSRMQRRYITKKTKPGREINDSISLF